MSKIARSGWSVERALHGLLAVGRLGHDLEVGLCVEDDPEPAQNDGMVVGDQDADLQRRRHRRGLEGKHESYLGSAVARRIDRELRADQHRALAHAADAVRGAVGVAGQPGSVIADREERAAVGTAELELDARSAGMSGDVGERLLRDAVEDQLLLIRQRQARLQRAFHPDAGLVVKRRRQCRQGAGQPEVFECLGAQPSHDPADVLGAAARGLPQLVELVAQLLGDLRRQPFDLQHDAGQGLADLVVELAGDAPALTLLDHQRPPDALAPLGLQPVEHLVEGIGEGCDLRAAVDVHALAERERVMPTHALRQFVERPEGRTHQEEADREREPHRDEHSGQSQGP